MGYQEPMKEPVEYFMLQPGKLYKEKGLVARTIWKDIARSKVVGHLESSRIFMAIQILHEADPHFIFVQIIQGEIIGYLSFHKSGQTAYFIPVEAPES